MKEIHEKRRPVIGNKPSFERIFNNIVRLNRETDATVRLRINVDKENMDNAYELVDYCAQYNLQQMDLTLGMLKEFGCDHKCSGCNEKLYSTEEFAEEFLRFRAYVGRRGFHTAYEKMQPEDKVNACTMDSPNAYVIDPDGECYKCISQVGKKEYSIGNVRDVFDEHAHTKISPFEKEECVDCTYFPICKGGCLNSKRVANKQKCEVWKYITERLIAMDYNGGNNDGRESERDISRA